MNTFLKNIVGILSALLSGALLYLSFPPLEFSFLVWISLVPILISLNFTRFLPALLLCLLTGAVFGGLNALWLKEIPGIPFVSSVAVALYYFSVFFGLFGFIYCFVNKRTYFPKVLVAPFLWISIDYLKANFFFLALPWNMLGHSLYKTIPLIQIASFTSVYGISFIIVFVNAAIAEGIIWVLNRHINRRISQSSSYVAASSLVSAMVIICVVYLWGNYQVRTFEKMNHHDLLKVSLIQGNISQEEIWDKKLQEKIMDRYRKLTLQARKEEPDIIIWPETSVPEKLGYNPQIDLLLKTLVRETGIPLLLGSSSYAKLQTQGRKVRRDKNTAFLINSNGEVIDSYHKIKLFPFWEYLPLEGKFSWPRWLVPRHGTSIPGNKPEVFRIPKGRFGVVICWENCFANLFRSFINGGAQFMVNITNEAIFGKTIVPRQILSMAVFRAVEHRVALLRCANTGITAFIDPTGRIRNKLVDKEGNDLMVTGILTVSVPEPVGPTFYTQYGDVFVITCSIISLLLFTLALLPAKLRAFLRIAKSS
jgi:apolipoprotein N-acyltransferase